MLDKRRTIIICTGLYTKEAVLNAVYRFTNKFYIKAENNSETEISISFSNKDDTPVTDETIASFYNELTDQQIRINVEREYKSIRDELVRRAFASISK